MWNSRSCLQTLKPYSIDEREWEVKIDANESPVNLPPLVHERVISRLSFLPFNRYPDMSMKSLRELIACSYAVTMDNVLIGNGSSQILETISYVFGGPGHSIVFPTPSFSMYGIYAKKSDSQGVPVTLEKDYSLSRDKMLQAAVQTNASLIIICNPNNPTGNIMPLEDIEYIVENAKCPVVVDEAYHEFYGGPSAIALLKKYANLIVARTFSKAYGLAAARVGYMLACTELVNTVGKAMMPYNVNALSLTVAEVVYQMRDEFTAGIEQTVSERKRMAEFLADVPGITVYPSETNFLLIKSDDAQALNVYLAERGIGVRDFSNASGLTGCMRVSVGTPVENDVFLQAVKGFRRVLSNALP